MTTLPFNPHDARVVEDTNYKILNSSQGVRNYIPKEDFFSMMIKVFNEVSKNLTAHCGPYSKSALVISPSGGKYETNTFTKDGRNIVASMNFVSPIEEIIKEMLLYIGSRVDNKSGDGTTSSMYIAARFFNIVADKFKDTIVNSRQFSQSYKIFESMLNDELEKEKITIDDFASLIYEKDKDTLTISEYQTIVAIIAAFQTLSSSGGDTELAKAMYDIYLQSPKGTWDYVSTYHQKYENSKRYEVASDLYDYFVDANILNTSMLNENLYSEYKSDRCDLLVLPENIPDSGIAADALADFLLQVRTTTREGKPLVIICRSIGATLLNIINTHNNTNKDFSIVVFENLNNMMVTGVSMDLIGMSLSGGKSPYISSKSKSFVNENHVIHDVKVHYKNHKLYIDDLFSKDGEYTLAHPYYKDPDAFLPYTVFLTELKNRYDRLHNDINQIQYKAEADDIQNLIGKLCFPRRPYLMIGGASHDHAEAIDVVRDVCGAINSSLSYGFTCGSSLALFRALYRLQYRPCNDTQFILYIALFKTIIELIHITKFGYLESDVSDVLADIDSCIARYMKDTNCENIDDSIISNKVYINYLNNNTTTGDIVVDVRNMLNNKDMDIGQHINTHFVSNYPIIQPSTVFEQLLYRIGELMIKLITTECVIVPGAVYMDN